VILVVTTSSCGLYNYPMIFCFLILEPMTDSFIFSGELFYVRIRDDAMSSFFDFFLIFISDTIYAVGFRGSTF
jgi:hypothetical protein